MSRSRSQSGNVRGESGAFRNELIAGRDEERPGHPTSRAARIRESCERRAASGSRADRIVAGPAAAAAVAEALKRCHTAGTGYGGKTSRRNVVDVKPARHKPGLGADRDARDL